MRYYSTDFNSLFMLTEGTTYTIKQCETQEVLTLLKDYLPSYPALKTSEFEKAYDKIEQSSKDQEIILKPSDELVCLLREDVDVTDDETYERYVGDIKVFHIVALPAK